MMSALPSPDEGPFTAEAISQLQVALNGYLIGVSDREKAINAAMARICTEAHARHLPPEKMLILVKAAFHDLEIPRLVDEERRQNALEAAVAACIKAYFSGT